ncbi:MAG: hypothetical protein NPINA01_15500 [Nitrospinaceae bacterium]|nr:MAG: hypothetical protein NPINA01_15500 [Nitrospinaceae bacterium]
MEDTNPVETSIKHSITKNGFPEKIVRLPFKPVYQSCKTHETALPTVLKNLVKEEIFGKIAGNHIEFRSPQTLHIQTEKPVEDNPFDLSGIQGGAQGDLMAAARSYLENMTPEQKAEIQKKVDNMSPEEKMNIMKMMSEQFKPQSP